MKTITKAALSLFVCALFALPQVSLAKKPDRDPSAVPKDCPFEGLGTEASNVLLAAYDEVGLQLSRDAFISKDPVKQQQNADGLKCKISGAELKFSQEKFGEASYLLDIAIEKIYTLFPRKLTWEGLDAMDTAFKKARDCITKMDPAVSCSVDVDP